MTDKPKRRPRGKMQATLPKQIPLDGQLKNAEQHDALDAESYTDNVRLDNALASDSLTDFNFGMGSTPGDWDFCTVWLRRKGLFEKGRLYFTQIEPEKTNLGYVDAGRVPTGGDLWDFCLEKFAKPHPVTLEWKAFADGRPRKYGRLNLPGVPPVAQQQQPPPPWAQQPPPPWAQQPPWWLQQPSQQPPQQPPPQPSPSAIVHDPRDQQIAVLSELVNRLMQNNGQVGALPAELIAKLDAIARPQQPTTPAPQQRDDIDQALHTLERLGAAQERIHAMQGTKPTDTPAPVTPDKPATEATLSKLDRIDTPDGFALITDRETGDLKVEHTALMASGLFFRRIKELIEDGKKAKLEIAEREAELVLKVKREEAALAERARGTPKQIESPAPAPAPAPTNGTASGIDFGNLWKRGS